MKTTKNLLPVDLCTVNSTESIWHYKKPVHTKENKTTTTKNKQTMNTKIILLALFALIALCAAQFAYTDEYYGEYDGEDYDFESAYTLDKCSTYAKTNGIGRYCSADK